MKQQFEVFADYFQFYLQNEQSQGNLSNSWTKKAVSDMLAVAPGVVGVGTVWNMNVPVEVEVLDSRPDDDFDEWEHVTEASLEVPSGHIIIAGCTDYLPDAARITVNPGTYRVRIYYGALDSVDEFRLDSDDHYRLVLWLDANKIKPKVLKRWKFAPDSISTKELAESPATKLLHQGMDKSRQELFPEAFEYYTQAIQLNPTLHEAYFLRGCVKSKLGDMQGGIEDIEKVIEIFSNQGDFKSASFYRDWLNRWFIVSN